MVISCKVTESIRSLWCILHFAFFSCYMLEMDSLLVNTNSIVKPEYSMEQDKRFSSFLAFAFHCYYGLGLGKFANLQTLVVTMMVVVKCK